MSFFYKIHINAIKMFLGENFFVPLHQQKKEIQRKGQRRIGRASHGCLSIVIEGTTSKMLMVSHICTKTFINR